MNLNQEELVRDLNKRMKNSGLKGFEIAMDYDRSMFGSRYVLSIFRTEEVKFESFHELTVEISKIMSDIENSPLILNLTAPLQKEIETLKEENKELQKLNTKLTERLLGESDD